MNQRSKERLAYVLGRMQDDGVISAEDKDHALAAPPKLVAFEQKRRDSGLHFIDFLGREAKSDGVVSLTAEPYTVHSTINATLQREAEAALQEGLARYETSAGCTQLPFTDAMLQPTGGCRYLVVVGGVTVGTIVQVANGEYVGQLDGMGTCVGSSLFTQIERWRFSCAGCQFTLRL